MSFGRKYLLRIAQNTEQFDDNPNLLIDAGVGGGRIKPPATGDVLSLPPLEAIAFSELNLITSIPSSKKASTSSSPATITLYNISTASLAKIKPNSTIILQAGYESDKELPVIYAGQIVKIKPEKQGINRTVKLVCSSAFTITKNVRISKSFPPGKTYKQIIDSLVEEVGKYGLPLGAFHTVPQVVPKDKPPSTSSTSLTSTPNGGYATSGFLMDDLTNLCESIGFRCYIALSKLYIEPKEYAKTLEVVTLTPDIIIGNIKPEQDTAKSLTGSGTDKTGLTVVSLLDGSITIAKKLRIKEGTYKGYYDIESVNHSLNLEGREWYTKMKLVGVTSE